MNVRDKVATSNSHVLLCACRRAACREGEVQDDLGGARPHLRRAGWLLNYRLTSYRVLLRVTTQDSLLLLLLRCTIQPTHVLSVALLLDLIDYYNYYTTLCNCVHVCLLRVCVLLVVQVVDLICYCCHYYYYYFWCHCLLLYTVFVRSLSNISLSSERRTRFVCVQ